MTSILTNPTAMRATSALAETQRSLATTQTQLATGLGVSSAEDNGAYFAIATTMNTRVSNLEALDEGLKLTSAILAVTGTALATITQLTRGIGADLVAAQQPGVDVSAVQSDIASKQAGILAAAQAATFNGVNWLVTRVVGTDTFTRTDDDDVSKADALAVDGAHAIGTFDDAVDETTVQAVTRTLASSSTAQSRTSGGATFHIASNVIDQPPTVTVDGAYQTSSSSGDPDNYRSLGIPVSVASDGSVISVSEDFQATELFATFSGTAERSEVEGYTDETDVLVSPPTMLSRSVPYVDARDDVLDRTIFTSVTPGNLLNMTIHTASAAAAASGAVGQALQGLSEASSFIGGLQTMVDGVATSNAALVDALKIGVGSLVDADMDADSTRLAALQTQQQLGVQALGIANSNAQVILQLFGGR